jgi:uncharacterized membrane protein YesL
MSLHLSDSAKAIADITVVGTGVAVVLKWLPAVAALVTILVGLVRLYESRMVKDLWQWYKRRRYRRKE